MRALIASVAVAGAALLGVVAAGQQTQPLPGPGTGIVPVTVKGSVDIGTVPVVPVSQQGDWNVRVANTPTVIAATPEFVRTGLSYAITWANGDQERIAVVGVGTAGWIRADRDGRSRWINLASARAVEEAR